ncbi:MAG TPA: c-type cytochrome [Vicinamibacterales bacterium]|nr:c-type cytochrome [Vicinamibacterales bacterium]
MKILLLLALFAQAERVNPLASRPDALPGGAKLFKQKCAMCHGEDGRGTSKAPDLSRDELQALSDGELFQKITGGNVRRDMPSFSNIPELQRWQLVLKLRSLVKAH